MCGGADRIEKAGVGVRREVHDNVGLRGDRARDLDVEQDLAVSALRVLPSSVAGAVHADRRHGRLGDAEPGEVRVQIALAEPAAEFDDRQALPGAVGARRHPVDLRQVEWRVARTRCGCRGHSELGTGLRPVVQSQNRGHDPSQLSRDAEVAGAVPDVDAAPVQIGDPRLLQGGAEQRLQGAGGSGNAHSPRRGIALDHLGTRLGDGAADEVDVGRVGAELRGEIRAVDAAGHRLSRQFSSPPQHQGDLDRGARGNLSQHVGRGQGLTETSRQNSAILVHDQLLRAVADLYR